MKPPGPASRIVALALALWASLAAADGRQKLNALEDARRAGILTDAEYARKKAELEAQLRAAEPPLDPATRQKLQALETARRAGILTPAEYQRKKAAILGERPPKRTARLPTGKKGKVYHHPLGYTFWYPAGWAMTQHEQLIQLTPPDAAPKGKAEELYCLLGESLADEGITRVDDPRVAAFLDKAVRSVVPSLQRVGAPAWVATAKGKGLMLEWQARSPQGAVVRAKAFANLIKNHGVALVAVGLQERLAAREPVLREIFASFGFGEGRRDPALVGAWAFVSNCSIWNWSPFESDYSRARLYSEANTGLVLRADGTWTRTTRRRLIAFAGGLSVDEKRRDVTTGRWNGADGSVYFISDDNRWQIYQYQIRPTAKGRQLKLICGQSAELWEEHK